MHGEAAAAIKTRPGEKYQLDVLAVARPFLHPVEAMLIGLLLFGPMLGRRTARRGAAGRPLGESPVIGLLLVVQVLDARDMRNVSVLLRPLDCLILGLEGGEDVVLDNIVIMACTRFG
jgi:hypothetical protein